MAQEIIIRLRDVSTGKTFTFPANPESISGTLGAKYQSFDIISKGTVKVPKGTDVSEIKWSGEFFGSPKKKESIVLSEYYMQPQECIAQLREWQETGTILNLIVTDTWINLDVTISSFTPEVYGAYGNVKYSISFVQSRDLKIYTASELKIAGAAKKKKKSRSSSNGSDSKYTVKSGDTLWGIAAKKLGSGTKWTKIYNANSSTIEAAAKKHGMRSSNHGHWIYPGTVLVIPAA